MAVSTGSEPRESEHARFAELHRSLIANLRRVVGEAPAFCFCGDYLASGLLVGSACQGGGLYAVAPAELETLVDIEAGSGATPRITGLDDSPLACRAPRPYAVANRASEERVVWLALAARGQLLGVVGATISASCCPEAVREAVAGVSAQCSSFADIFIQHQELNRWLDVTDHLPSFDGVCAVVDASRAELLWVGARKPQPTLDQEIRERASAIAGLVARSASRLESDPPVSYPLLDQGTIVHVEPGKALTTFGGEHLAVVAIHPHSVESDDDQGSTLSRRERQVSQLLVDGYTIVNAAAILGITENTVRTYVRRLYRKLGVNTRTDLVRQLHARLA